jgi:hypothetical protein
MSDEELQTEAQTVLENLALAISSPEALARAFGYWLKQKMPERVAESMWVDIEGNRDKGISVKIFERPLPRWPALKVRLGGLIGLKTYGADLEMEVYKTSAGAHVMIGAGLVAPYSGLEKFSPVATLSVRF